MEMVVPYKKEDYNIGIKLSKASEEFLNHPNIAPVVNEPEQKKRGRKPGSTNSNNIITPGGNNQQSGSPTDYHQHYSETDNLLRSTIAQIDMATASIEMDVNTLRKSTNARNKYVAISNLVGSQASLLGNKIAAIREMNSSITKAKDMEYKVMKELKLDAAAQDDDKAIMDMYAASIRNPSTYNAIVGSSFPAMGQATSLITPAGAVDAPTSADQIGFSNYMNSLSPEQNMMLLENDPNIEEVVCYDPSNGGAFFDIIDKRTGQSVPNTPKRSASFLDNTIIDTDSGLAKNSKLNKVWKVVYVGNNTMRNNNPLSAY